MRACGLSALEARQEDRCDFGILLLSACFSIGLIAFFLLTCEVLFIFQIVPVFSYHRQSLQQAGVCFHSPRGVFMESRWPGLPHVVIERPMLRRGWASLPVSGAHCCFV